MNTKATSYVSMLLAFCLTVFASVKCSNPLETDYNPEFLKQSETFTLEKAMSAFKEEYNEVITISHEKTSLESPFVWESGDILPIWKIAEHYGNQDNSTEYFIVPILTSKNYYVSCGNNNDTKLIKCRQELLIANKKLSGKTISSILFHIPAVNSESENDNKSHFSGLIVYTNLRGTFKKIERYEDGNIVDGIYFGEKESTIAKERHLILINQIMEGTTIIKLGDLSITSRSNPTDTVEFNDTITGSYCTGDKYPDQWWLSSEFWFYNEGTGQWEFCPDSTYNGPYPDLNENTSGGNGGGIPKDIGSKIENGQGGSPSHNQNRPTDCSEHFGSPDYYIKRYEDYCRRHNIKTKPEIYYISYGYKYCAQFNDLKERKVLSAQGEEWVDKTKIILQKELEQIIMANPSIEDNIEELTRAAFKTHPKAYIEGGILQLSLIDKLKIVLAIDYKDLISDLGREQVQTVISAQIEYYKNQTYDTIRDAMDLSNNCKHIKQMLQDYTNDGSITRSGIYEENERKYQDIVELLLGEIIGYFYDNVEGFEINDLYNVE